MRTDAEIASTVTRMLKWHVGVEDKRITMKVEKGIVTLEGSVDWAFQRQAVEDTVRCLPGIVRLDNFIDLNPDATPEHIRGQILAKLGAVPGLDRDKISIDVAGNKVVLRGKVNNVKEKIKAGKVAWSVYGVTAVDNQLLI